MMVTQMDKRKDSLDVTSPKNFNFQPSAAENPTNRNDTLRSTHSLHAVDVHAKGQSKTEQV
jgi:hypothetical protein